MNQRVYVDTNAREHWVTKELSRGGQGRVMRTREPDIALKLELVDGETQTDAQQIEVRNQRYRRLRLLPIPQGLTITLPQATLTDHVGYVMELLEEMIPFGKAFDQEQQIPADALRQTEWMCRTFCGEELQTAAENYSRWYTTGGARRRLCAWQKAAILVERLHGNGLVYCDFSMNNLFISEQTQQEDEAVWLIDADNLHIIGEPGGAYTPGYHAPELVLDPAHPQFSFASDSYSFAILLFESLTMQHPFHGRMYEDEDDWDDPIEDRIDCGEIPWILDEEDPSNQVEQLLLATEYFLSDELNTLFARCFSAEGRMNPVSRPTMAEWSEELSRLLDCTVACPGCGLHFNAGESEGTRIRCHGAMAGWIPSGWIALPGRSVYGAGSTKNRAMIRRSGSRCVPWADVSRRRMMPFLFGLSRADYSWNLVPIGRTGSFLCSRETKKSPRDGDFAVRKMLLYYGQKDAAMPCSSGSRCT